MRSGLLVAACAALVVLFVLGAPKAARADDAATRADVLFKEAKALVEQGRYAEACPKLEESQSIDPAVGTQFNLADCYEHVGRIATAHALFSEVARVAKLAGKFEREKSARERVLALAPRIGRLRVDVTADVPGLEVQVSKKPLAKVDWSAALPHDAGTYVVVASAPEHAAFEAEVVVKDGATASITIPALASTAEPPPPMVPPPPAPAPRGSTNKTLAIVAGGVGVVGIGVGATFGVLAITKHSDADGQCPKDVYHGNCPTQAGADAWSSAQSAGNVSTIAFVAGGVALAAAGVLWLTAPKASVAAGVGPGSFAVRGAF